jgi:hypothetical protein
MESVSLRRADLPIEMGYGENYVIAIHNRPSKLRERRDSRRSVPPDKISFGSEI